MTDKPKNLNDCSPAELRQFFDSFDQVLCDIDGVVVILTQPIHGVQEAIENLRTLGKSVKFVTNNCSATQDKWVYIFGKHKIPTHRDDFITPIVAIIQYLKSINFDKKIYLAGLPDMRQEMEEAGFVIDNPIISDRVELTIDGFTNYMKTMVDNPDIGAVIFEFDVNLSYMDLNRMKIYLQRPDCLFITGGNDRDLIVGPKLYLLGSYYFQQILTQCTKREPICIGKPHSKFNDFIHDKYKFDTSRTLLIGDSIEQDMEFATKCGYKKLLVLTGNAKLADLEACDPLRSPDYFINSISDLNDLIKTKLPK